jgi:hypothetical protein
MVPSLERLKTKIEKLTVQQHQIEETYIGVVAQLVKDLTQKGYDLPVLTGILLNANDIMSASPTKMEAWQVAGQKFLLKSKNRRVPSKMATTKGQDQAVTNPI